MKKQFYPIATKLKYAVALILTLFLIHKTDAQDVTITSDPVTWGWFNDYPNTTVNGNLTIAGAVPDLVELGDNFWQNLTTVTGDLRIIDCPSLSSLNGLQHLTSVGGDVIVEDNPSLQSLDSLKNLISIGGKLRIARNASIISLTPNIPWALTSVQDIIIANNDQLTGLDPFQGITTINSIDIVQNPNFSFINSFYNLQSASYIGIHQNTALSSRIGFGSLTSLNTLEVTGNSVLQDCCGLLPLINIAAISTNINANATGCESLAVVDGPPTFDICPGSYLTSIDPGSCGKGLPVRLPIATDNCDFQIATVKITLGDGSIWFDGEYGSPGNTFTYPGVPGMNTFEFVATDMNGNSSACTTEIEIQDDEIPEPIPGFFQTEYFVDGGPNCEAEFSIVGAGFSDPCGMAGYRLEINGPSNNGSFDFNSSGFNFTEDFVLGNYDLIFTGEDVNGLQNTLSSTLQVRDITAPVWNDVDGKNTVTIECGSMTIAEAVAANMPVATDCAGSTITMGSPIPQASACGPDGVLQLITATDPNNNSSAPYELTIQFEDTAAPVLSGVPADKTINCTDVVPALPTLTAMDGCDGNISSAISVTAIPTEGSCGNGMVAQTFNYTASISDACGNTAEENWKVTVVSDLDVDLGPDQSSCDGGSAILLDAGISGQTYAWSTGASSKTISVSSTGTYAVTVSTANGCCSVDEITITTGSPPNISAAGGTISCSSGSIQLMGTSSTGGVSYSWTGPSGFSSSMQNPSVSVAGEYTLKVTTADGCESEETVSVLVDNDVPELTAEGAVISCASPTVDISASSSTAGVTYFWTGPDGFSSSSASASVSLIGDYTDTATAPNGCTSETSVSVTGNTDIPEIMLTGGTLTCGDTAVVISVESNLSLLSIEWTGPDGFSSSENTPSVTSGGEYEVTVEAVNGCVSTERIEVFDDFSSPDLMVTGGILNCAANSVMIVAESTTDASFTWSGPDEFISTEASPQVTQPGTYIVTAQAANGCTTTDSTEVSADTNLPDVSATGGTLDCTNDVVTLVGQTSTENATFSWTGPNGYASDNAQNDVTEPGEYTFTVVAESGCTSFKTIEITLDIERPDVLISEGVILCDMGMRQFSVSTNAVNPLIDWSGPGGFTSDLFAPLYSAAGTYNLTITSSNSCATSVNIDIQDDVNLTAEVTTDGSSAEALINGGTGPFTFVWDGEVGGESLSGLDPGEHTLSIVDGLDCRNDFTFTINTSSLAEVDTDAHLIVSPNPVRDVLRVNIKSNWRPKKLRIFQVNGALLMTREVSSNEMKVDVSELKSGIYFLLLENEENHEIRKFVRL